MGPFVRDTHNLTDVLRFMLTFSRRRRAKVKVSHSCKNFLSKFRESFVAWFFKLFDRYILVNYLESQTARDQPAVSLRHCSDGKRTYTVVTPEARWDLLAKSRSVVVILGLSHTVLTKHSPKFKLGARGRVPLFDMMRLNT